jgi:hypothetical protein
MEAIYIHSYRSSVLNFLTSILYELLVLFLKYYKMYITKVSTLSIVLLAVIDLVAGHSAIIAATGDQGGAGSAIGSTAPSQLNLVFTDMDS